MEALIDTANRHPSRMLICGAFKASFFVATVSVAEHNIRFENIEKEG
jgi:hypothetical protein